MQPPAPMSYPVPFFPDYVINFPYYYTGGRNLTGVSIYTVKGRYVKPKYNTWILKNPNSDDDRYQHLYNKNIVGSYSQSIYDSDIRQIYNYLKRHSALENA